jgi:hypothetical protein
MIDTIPGIECVNGTLLPVAVPHVVNQDLDSDVYNALAIGFERAIDAYLHSGRYHSRAAALKKWFRAPNGVSGLVRALGGNRDLPERVIYKEPFLSFSPSFVLDALPDAQILYLVRDGRDCANSLRRTYDVLTDEKLTHLRGTEMRMGRAYDDRYVPWWVAEGRDEEFIRSTPYVRAIWMWKAMIQRCHEVFFQPGAHAGEEAKSSSQVMCLQYENLMREPATSGTAVLNHLGAEPTAAFSRKVKQAHTQSIGKHKQRSSKQIRSAERVAGCELKLYGYELHSQSGKRM